MNSTGVIKYQSTQQENQLMKNALKHDKNAWKFQFTDYGISDMYMYIVRKDRNVIHTVTDFLHLLLGGLADLGE